MQRRIVMQTQVASDPVDDWLGQRFNSYMFNDIRFEWSYRIKEFRLGPT
jgi:hypothetical protein